MRTAARGHPLPVRAAIDHLTIRVPDADEARRFYGRALELLGFGVLRTEGDGFAEWSDFSIAPETPERPATRGLHVAFQARDRAQVEAWWETLTADGHPDDGLPGPRPEYGPTYYGAFVLDAAGNSVEATHNRPRRDDGTVLDHLWIRVRDLATSTAFYEAVAPVVGHRVERLPGRTMVRGDGATFSLLEGPATKHVHLAFAAPDAETVARFHEAGLAAGYDSLGEPGERPEYHPGYVGAYLADPDGHNVEAVFHDR